MIHRLHKVIFSVLTILATPLVHGQVSSIPLCESHQRFLEDRLAHSISVEELAKIVAKKRSSVIFIGETHHESNSFYPTLLHILKVANPDLDCVTFEVGAVPIPEASFQRPEWQALAEAARQEGLATYKVDHCIPHPRDRSGDNCLQGRNESMAANILALLKTHTCHRILQPNGTLHLEHGFPSAGPPLPDRLKARGVVVFKIRLVDPATRLRQEDPWIWGQVGSDQSVCPNKMQPSIPTGNFVFRLNSSLAHRVPFTLLHNPLVKSDVWSNYDAALIIDSAQK